MSGPSSKADVSGPVLVSGFDSVTVPFTWEVKNFRFVVQSPNKLINAQGINLTVNAGPGRNVVTKWRLSLTTNIIDNKTWIGIYHQLTNAPEVPVYSVFKFVIKGDPRKFETDVRQMSDQNCGWGFPKAFDKAAPVTSFALVDGSLVVTGEVLVLTEHMPDSFEVFNVPRAERKAASRLASELESFWEKGTGRDAVVVMSSDGVEHHSNKFILSARSPVFEAMFNSKMLEEDTGILKLDDCPGKVVGIMLQYLHAGKFAPEGFATSDDILEVAYVAEKYELSELHEFCDRLLADKWDKTRAEEMLDVADKLRLFIAKYRITEYIEQFLRVTVGNKKRKLDQFGS